MLEIIKEQTTITFESMIFLPIEFAENNPDFQPIQSGISATLGLAGNFSGSVSIHMTKDLANEIAAALLFMEDETPDIEDVKDAIGELANMLAGSIKHELPGNGEGTKLSIPTVIVGSDYTIPTTKGATRTVASFKVNNKTFVVDVQSME